MTRLLLCLSFVLFAAPVWADNLLYISPAGDDSNNCATAATACRTWQRAYDVCPKASACEVNVADGAYVEEPNIYYYKFLSFKGNCSNLTAVTLYGVFTVQDHAIGALSCIQVRGIYSRQFAIVDYYFVTFMEYSEGVHVNASENSKINCLGADYSAGQAAVHFSAGGQSSILVGCAVVMLPGTLHFGTAFAMAGQQSYINVSGSVGGLNLGRKCIISDSSLILNGAALPGTGGC